MGGGREDGEWQEEEGSEVRGPRSVTAGTRGRGLFRLYRDFQPKGRQVTDLRVLLLYLTYTNKREWQKRSAFMDSVNIPENKKRQGGNKNTVSIVQFCDILQNNNKKWPDKCWCFIFLANRVYDNLPKKNRSFFYRGVRKFRHRNLRNLLGSRELSDGTSSSGLIHVGSTDRKA